MQDKIFFSDSKGNKICGILSNPTEDSNVPVIILCHGFMVAKESNTNVRLEQLLNKEKIATFRFDFFGHGESGGDFEDITVFKAVDNILDVIKYLKEKGFSKIGLVGSSFGGISGTMAASKINDLFVLVLKSPVSDYLEVEARKRTKQEIEKWKSDGFIAITNYKGEAKRLNYSFFEGFKDNNAYEVAKKIKIPTLIVHGDQDEIIPIEQSEKISEIIENCKLEIIKGANHEYSKQEDFEKMLNLISKFIVETIE